MPRTISIQYVLGALFCIFALIPWVNFGTNDLDSQPWPILFGIVFLISCGPVIKAPPNTLSAFFLVTLGFVFSVISSESFGGFLFFRAAVNYVGFFTAYIAFYTYVERYGFPWRIFISVNVIWLIMAGVELVAPEVTESISKRRTTLDRGVTSLAPEPTFFAIYLFFNSWLMLTACAFRPNRWLALLLLTNMAFVVLLAKSTMGVLFIAIAAMAFAWYMLWPLRPSLRGLGWLLGGIVLALLILIVFRSEALENSRLVKVYFYFKETSIRQLIMWDHSINQRLEGLVLSLHGALDNNLWPAGLDTYLKTRARIIGDYDGLFWWLSETNIIMSWIGAFVYELGVFGIVALAVLTVASYEPHNRKSRVSLVLLGIVLLSAVPPSFPLVPMLLALMVAQKRTARLALGQHQLLRTNFRRQLWPRHGLVQATSSTFGNERGYE